MLADTVCFADQIDQKLRNTGTRGQIHSVLKNQITQTYHRVLKIDVSGRCYTGEENGASRTREKEKGTDSWGGYRSSAASSSSSSEKSSSEKAGVLEVTGVCVCVCGCWEDSGRARYWLNCPGTGTLSALGSSLSSSSSLRRPSSPVSAAVNASKASISPAVMPASPFLAAASSMASSLWSSSSSSEGIGWEDVRRKVENIGVCLICEMAASSSSLL